MRRIALPVVCAVVALALPLPAAAQSPPAASQGRIVAINGRVEHTPPQQETWSAARLAQPLFTAERVRTLEASRASILFVDETQVKLNAGAVLTIREVRRGSGAPTTMDLSRGEAWFRTKNPRAGVTVQTPAAAAAIRGTEINVRIGDAGETVLTVVEGTVEFSNAAGSIAVNAGEEGTARPGQAPTKRVLLTPEDAVQWVLYYPDAVLMRELPGGAAGPAVAASMAALAQRDFARARDAVAAPPGGVADPDRQTQLAVVRLVEGDTAGARADLDALVNATPGARRAALILSSLELRRNNVERASVLAEQTAAASPQSVAALIAASDAAQARFDLPAARAYLDRALAIDPRDLQALVSRARIRFGSDDTAGARADLDAATAIAPDDAQVRSLRGFISLADGRLTQAQADFEAAIGRDAELGEPHLGLGLLHFRAGREQDGLFEMLTATLLEPKVALYQSYLGKAYYQARRFPEGLAALASAKRLDPRDPTPWLYASLYLRDQNQQVDALTELREAIARNDFRAVYRSRFLLDRDLATKNVSLAEIYRQLGFAAWGAYEALNSLETDLTNASAHLFLANSYGELPDRTQAFGSELLQYFLYAPVNRNSFNNFSEYTALLEQPRRELTVTGETGSREWGFGNLNARTGNERLATLAFIQKRRNDGPRPNVPDERIQGFLQAKVALGRRSDLFFTFSGVDADSGADETSAAVFGSGTLTPVIVSQYVTPDPRVALGFEDSETTLGFKHAWRPGAVLTAVGVYDERTRTSGLTAALTSRCRGFDLTPFNAVSDSTITNPFTSVDLQIQQTARFGRHQLIGGHQSYGVDKEDLCAERISIGAESADFEFRVTGRDTATTTGVRDEWQLNDDIHATVGVDYQRVTYQDLGAAATTTVDDVSPRLGISARLSPTTVVRAAAFRQLNTNFIGDSIGPPTVAGFVVARNEFPTTRRKEVSVAVEHSRHRGFVSGRAFFRDSEVPLLLERDVNFIPEADATGAGVAGTVNVILTRRLTLFADDQFVRFGASAFDRTDNLARVGLNLISPRGLFVRVTGSHVRQRFSNTAIADLPRSTFALVDLDISYEFGGKRGLANFRVTNAFDRRFAAVLESITIDPFIPDRRAYASLRWRLF
jgi:tetratricopeptide (TPR) repeat protein